MEIWDKSYMQTQKLQSTRCVSLSSKPFFAVLLLGLIAGAAQAAPITPGNLVIYRVGDGTAALGTTATAIFLDEYTPGGTLVQSIPLPTSGGTAFTAVGNASTEGIISRSQDGTSLIFTGYQKAAGGTSPAADAYTVTPREIGTLTASGTFSIPTTLINDNALTTANTIRSATSVDGLSAFWVSTSSRVSYLGAPSPSGAGTVQIDARNSRQVNLSGNTLFAANGSTAITGKVQTYGTLPTGATAPTPVVTLTTADAVNGFALFDLDGVAGDDTLYALSTVANQLLKYSLVGGSWVASGSISASGASNLAGYSSGSTVNLFLTTASTLYSEVDASGYNSSITGSPTSLATAGVNTAFRGVGMFPVVVPEPSVLSLGLVGAGLLALRRRRA
jgi:hypothetical protein